MYPLKVLIVDDHSLFRQGLVSLMNTHPDLVEVVGEAASGREAVELVQRLRPQVVLLDILMPDGDGLEAARAIRRLSPGTAIVMLTSSDLDEHLNEAVRIGVSGYLLKNLNAEELFELLRGIERGEAAITRTMAARLLRGPSTSAVIAEGLTERELDVLRLVARGFSNAQVAEELCVTVNTVKSHLKSILSKLQVENRTQAAAYATRTGLVEPGLPPGLRENHPKG